jgi:hypothetical protein
LCCLSSSLIFLLFIRFLSFLRFFMFFPSIHSFCYSVDVSFVCQFFSISFLLFSTFCLSVCFCLLCSFLPVCVFPFYLCFSLSLSRCIR